jgi:hypothetical protein
MAHNLFFLKKSNILSVHIIMDTMAFNQSIQLTHMRENLIGSALARYFNSSIHFIEDNERRSEYDFSLYNPIKGWALAVMTTCFP